MKKSKKILQVFRYACLVAVVLLGLVSIVGTGGGGGGGDGDNGDGGEDGAEQTLTVTITNPADSDAFPVGDNIDFDGTGDDPEDGTLSGDSLVWESDVDGEIGQGESFSTDTLSEGEHTITLTGTNSQGDTADDTITITVSGTITASSTVPDTGQTTCYDADGNVLDPCPSSGQDFYGQDACYTINPPSFTKLDENGNELADSATDWAMVRDDVTGLIWEVKTADGGIHDKNNQYDWYDASDVFIAQLNNDSFGGYSDWRLPTIKELAWLNNLGVCDPAIDIAYFPETMSSRYWSSTTYANDTDNAWHVYFDGGSDGNVIKSNTYYVRAVRGGQATNDFTDNGDGTVTDHDTGLMWAQNTADIDGDGDLDADDEVNWQIALAWCEDLSLAGYDDWRLPTRKELRSIVDYDTFDPAIDTAYFPDTMSSSYWSSTTNLSNGTDNAWPVYFNDGNDYGHYKSSIYYVRAVRGGQ